MIFVVITYLVAPMPGFLCTAESDESFWKTFLLTVMMGNFLTGILIASGFALPVVLLHVGALNSQYSAYCGVAGGLIVYTGVLAYLHYFMPSEESAF